MKLPRATLKELADAHRRLHAALAASSIGIWECEIDPDRDIREGPAYSSKTLLKMLGYGPDEKADTLDWYVSRYHPDDTARILAAAERLLSDGTPFDVEFRMKTNSGAYGWFRSTGAYAEWDESAKVFRVCGTFVDITSRKQSQESLLESETRFRSLMEQSPLATAIFLPDGKIEEVNSAWRQSWGLSEEEAAEAISKYNMRTDPQLAGLGLAPLVERAFAGERIVLPPLHYDGTRTIQDFDFAFSEAHARWIQCYLYPVTDNRGDIAFVVITNMDITAQKLADDALKASEVRFRSLMEQSPLAMEMLTPDGEIEQVNSAWNQLWGVSEEEAAEVISKYNMLTDPQIADLGILPLVKRAFAGERIVLPLIQYSAAQTTQDFGMQVDGARTPWIQCHLYPVKDDRGDMVYLVNTYMDVTKLKRVEQDAQEQREALARTSRATRMGQLTGSIAHELNQPLTGILSTAQAGEMMIQNERMNRDELADVMAAIVSDAKRAGEVIRNLRELYKDHKAESLPVDLNRLIEETLHLLKSEFVFQQVQVSQELTPSLPRVSGNRAQLQQVLVNLIMNGNAAMSRMDPQRRRLTIASEGGEAEIRIWVEDCGPGIDKGQIESIFEPLATWKPGGTGMGLAISNSILESHHGYMWAENRPESGARVGFTLPVSQENPTP